MNQKCRDLIWWLGIDTHIEQFVKNCEACVLSKKAGDPRPAPLQPRLWLEKPWQQPQVDIFGVVRVAPHNQKYLIIVHDLHSKWPEITATSLIAASSIISILDKTFTRWGLPESIATDNGPQFTSEEFTQYLKANGIEHHQTTWYNPQSTGGVERFNRVIKESIKASLADEQTFDQAIHTLLCSFRSTPHSLTRKMPTELMKGRNLRLPLNLLKPPASAGAKIEVMAKPIVKRQQKMKEYADKRWRAKSPSFAVGQWVRVKLLNRAHKLATSLSPPQQILQQLGHHGYQLGDGIKCNLLLQNTMKILSRSDKRLWRRTLKFCADKQTKKKTNKKKSNQRWKTLTRISFVWHLCTGVLHN
uniref:Integrase catalytic domain-containing protein n=1 Tax=Eptatretus burgeri TaxID=7764 RepID=A0A8C4QXD9_EPTBU